MNEGVGEGPADLLELLEQLGRIDEARDLGDAVARLCALEAGFDLGLLVVSLPDGTLVGGYHLSEEERGYFLERARTTSVAERRANRRRLRELAFPGTGIAYVPNAAQQFHVVAPTESGAAGTWDSSSDALYLLVEGSDGDDVGILSLDLPLDGRRPTSGALDRLRRAERLLNLARPLLERALLRERLNDREALLLQAQKLDVLGRLACEVAHDLNNLLMIANGYAALVQDELAKGTDLHEMLDQVQLTCQRGSALTYRLLSFGRAPSREPRAIDLHEVVVESADMLTSLVRDRARLELESEQRPLLVMADPDQLTQVLLNLVVNARDASTSGGRVGVRTGAFDDESSRWVYLEVSDQGVGMDEATMGRIFEPFYTTKDDGSGVGLATVKRIVERLEGRVYVQSRPGAGTTFRIELPRPAQ